MRCLKPVFLSVCSVVLFVGCATSPTGRRQLQLFPESQMQTMGVQAYQQMKKETPSLQDKAVNGFVDCVVSAVTRVVPGKYARDNWEVTVFKSAQVNAFALPGGKIGVYTGLLHVTDNAAQLAAVLGHEIGHVIADHGNERMSTQFATSAGLAVAQAIAGTQSRQRQQALALLGLGAQVGIILPFSRTQETEADLIGLDLMAKAGFDPHESVALWQNMSRAGGKSPPEFLSTHPANATRIQNLRKRMPHAEQLYERARAEGHTPSCRKPAHIPVVG